MALRCLLFSSDEGAAQLIRQVLADLRIEGEYCPAAVGAVERVSSESFQLVIVDWENQPEAGFLLQTARERKASERPMTLAIVKDDSTVPQALQAGANSILRKPVLIKQVRETLTTARSLLLARREPTGAQAAAAAASAGSSTSRAGVSADASVSGLAPDGASPGVASPVEEKTLRAGEFLQSLPSAPSAQFVTESDADLSSESKIAEIDPLEELTPMAAAVETEKEEEPEAARRPEEPRGLSWYLNARAGTLPPVPAAPPTPPPPAKPELIGFDQTSALNPATTTKTVTALGAAEAVGPAKDHEKKAEAALFAYIEGEPAENSQKSPAAPRPWLMKAVLAATLAIVGGVAYLKVPQALGKQNIRLLVGYVVHTGKGWLTPPPVTPPQAPPTHENFGRAGDEYKLPVAENIPDATTDASQIRVLPVIDPTAKPQNGTAANGAQAPADSVPATTGSDQPPANTVQVQENPPTQPAPAPTQASDGPASGTTQPPVSSVPQPLPQASRPDPFAVSSTAPPAPASAHPAPPVPQTAQPNHSSAASTGGIPTSLKSQMVSMTPEASGNKPVEAALPSIEPVDLPELTVRGLIVEQPDLVYPASAKGQQGKVVLAVLIGRDGTVQDAKFLQGSLVFARSAIDNVKQWRFKPYTMNGRAVSTQTLLTINFKPSS